MGDRASVNKKTQIIRQTDVSRGSGGSLLLFLCVNIPLTGYNHVKQHVLGFLPNKAIHHH